MWRRRVMVGVPPNSGMQIHSGIVDDLEVHDSVSMVMLSISHKVKAQRLKGELSTELNPSCIEIMHIANKSKLPMLSYETFTIHPKVGYFGMVTESVCVSDLKSLKEASQLWCIILGVVDTKCISRETVTLLAERVPLLCLLCRSKSVSDEVLQEWKKLNINGKYYKCLDVGNINTYDMINGQQLVDEMDSALRSLFGRVDVMKNDKYRSDEECFSYVINELSSEGSLTLTKLCKHRYTCHLWMPEEAMYQDYEIEQNEEQYDATVTVINEDIESKDVEPDADVKGNEAVDADITGTNTNKTMTCTIV